VARVGYVIVQTKALISLATPFCCHEDSGDVDGKTWQQQGNRLCARGVYPVHPVHCAVQSQHGNTLFLGSDDPVFADARSGLFLALDFQVADAVFFPFTHDFHRQVSAFWRAARVGNASGADVDNVWLTQFPCP
jgi:hypothetical protein